MSLSIGNGRVSVELDEGSGCLTSLRHHELGLELIEEPRLAENYRILASGTGHYVRGWDQSVSDVRFDGESSVELTFQSLHDASGEHEIEARLTIALLGDDVSLTLTVLNSSPQRIDEAMLILGGLAKQKGADDWRVHFAQPTGAGHEWRIFREFPGSYLGPAQPMWFGLYHSDLSMPWIDIYDAAGQRGVMVANLDARPAAAISAAVAQLFPAGVWRNGTQEWPTREETGDQPVGLALGWVHFPFIEPGQRWTSPELRIHFHTGTWYAAARKYREWFDSAMPARVDERRSWLADRDAWQSTIVSYPDGTVGYRFSELPKLAAAAKRAGISVLQVLGWNEDGIDRNYPRYRPDPRLGTADELRNAIEQGRAEGVGVLLFVNLQWANVETDWWADELHDYAIKDPRGMPRNSIGWEYNTVLGLARQCEHRMVLMNPSHAGFKRAVLDELMHAVALGPSGLQIDKLDTACAVDYGSPPGASPDSSLTEGVIDTLEELVARARATDPRLGFAAETHWDRTMPYVDASYSRFFTEDHLPTVSVAFPELRQTVCVTGDFDTGLVNNAIRFGHVINIEGRYLHGSADDMPTLGPYVREVLSLRRRLWRVLWERRIVAPEGVGVDGPAYHTLRESADGTDRALVLSHFRRHDVEVDVAVDGVDAAKLDQPYRLTQTLRLPGTVTVPADRVVVLTWSQP